MPNAESLIGATLGGKFRIKRVLGAGSMGFVCEAEHLELGKRVAVKLIDAALAGDENISNRFRREARAASLVESEHIVQVFDVGRDERLGLYIVMENLVGEDLAGRLERESVLDIETSVRIAYQVARALSKAHAAGVIHRDLKPGNIFLVEREDGLPYVKILDFGISKLQGPSLDRSMAMQLTRTGTAVGTPQYMSPEQAQGLPTVDHRTDIWSLGVVLYEMLSGTLPFPELPTYEQFIIHMVTKPPRPLREVAPWVPAKVAQVVHDCIVHDPKARIGDGMSLAARLSGAVPSVSSGSIAKASGRHPVALDQTISPNGDDDDEPTSNETIVMNSPPNLAAVPRARKRRDRPEMDVSENGPATSRDGAAMQFPSSGKSRRAVSPRPEPYENVQNEEITDDDAPMFFQRESNSPSGKPLPFPSVKIKIPPAALVPDVSVAMKAPVPPAKVPEAAPTAMMPFPYVPIAVGVGVVVILGAAWQIFR